MAFIDRVDAGRRLASPLTWRVPGRDTVVLGLPRGGVPVAAEVAAALRAPLDVLLVRKLGVPFEPELAFGAVGEQSVRVVNEAVVRSARMSVADVREIETRERGVLEQSRLRYRGERPVISLRGKTAVIVDDGVATGSTARAACLVARARGAARVVLAVPVAPRGWMHRLRDVADDLVCLDTPRNLFAVGEFYEDFAAVTDEEVRTCLERAETDAARSGEDRSAPMDLDPEVVFRTRGGSLTGQLVTPAEAGGIVLFVDGARSPSDRRAAQVLNRAGLATLQIDLPAREETRQDTDDRDAAWLAERLGDATAWVDDWLRSLPVGYFGSGTGATAALLAAAEPDCRARAIVCRSARPDLLASRLPDVVAPTLLLVDEQDASALAANRRARMMLRCESRVAVVPGAGHGADLAADWFTAHLREESTTGPRSVA